MFTEFGADAFNAVSNSEDQESQAYYMVGNWKEIYANAAGMGNANNSIGGFTHSNSAMAGGSSAKLKTSPCMITMHHGLTVDTGQILYREKTI